MCARKVDIGPRGATAAAQHDLDDTDARPETAPFNWVLANPEKAFQRLAYVLHPVRWMRYLFVPLALAALLALWSNWFAMQDTLRRVLLSISFLQGLLLGMFTSNLVSKLRQGLAMARSGVPPSKFGIRLLFGLIPRFFINLALIRRLDFRSQAGCYVTPLLTRLGLSAIGILIWVLNRQNGSDLGNIALAMASTTFGAFLFTSNPLFQADGYRFLTAVTRMPDLRDQAFRTLGLVIKRKPLPPQMTSRRLWAMALYALCCALYTAFIVFFILSFLAISLKTQFRGVGVALFCLLIAVVIFFLVSRSAYQKRRKESKRARASRSRPSQIPWYGDPETEFAEQRQSSEPMKQDRISPPDTAKPEIDDAFDQALESILPPAPQQGTDEDDLEALLDAVLPDEDSSAKPAQTAEVPAVVQQPAPGPQLQPAAAPLPARPAPSNELDAVLPLAANQKKGKGWGRLLFWLILIVALVLIGTRPYQFTVGGEFLVQPIEPTQVRARTEGEIDTLHVSEGDWVEDGQVLAELANWEIRRDIAVRSAELERQEADLETLIAGPKQEEIALAQQELASNDAQVTLAQQTLDRQEALYTNGTISLKSLEEARGEFNVATAEREKAFARLQLLQTGALQSEIAAARANILRTERELMFSELKLEHTNIRSVSGGQIVSSLTGISVGSFLKEGDLFAEIADNRIVLAEIDVPETEIDEVKLDAEVTLRPWSAPDAAILGKVKRVAPSAQDRDFGKVIRVIVEVDNADGRLAGNMTGFAKIFVDERPVWRAFGRVFERFFLIEMWSWIP